MLTMIGGFTLAAFSIAISDGSYNQIIDMFTRNQLGHIQIHHSGYLDRPSLYKTIDGYQTICRQIGKVAGLTCWTPRVYASGLSSIGEKSAGVRIIGIDPDREDQATNFGKKISAGEPLTTEANHQVLLGRGLALVLKAELGDSLVVISQGADGSIANDLYLVRGIVVSGDEASDRSALYLHIKDAQELLVLGDRIHELVIIAEDLQDVRDLALQLPNTLADSTLAVAAWQEFAHQFYTAMKADQQGSWISLGIVVLLVAIGVLNTVLMTVMERRREYGLLKAIGTRPGRVVRLVLTETFIMAVISVLIGTAISLLVNYLFSIKGIEFPNPITYGRMEFSTMRAEINARSFYIPAITVVCAALFVSIWPAWRAARIAPAQAMRTH